MNTEVTSDRQRISKWISVIDPFNQDYAMIATRYNSFHCWFQMVPGPCYLPERSEGLSKEVLGDLG